MGPQRFINALTMMILFIIALQVVCIAAEMQPASTSISTSAVVPQTPPPSTFPDEKALATSSISIPIPQPTSPNILDEAGGNTKASTPATTTTTGASTGVPPLPPVPIVTPPIIMPGIDVRNFSSSPEDPETTPEAETIFKCIDFFSTQMEHVSREANRISHTVDQIAVQLELLIEILHRQPHYILKKPHSIKALKMLREFGEVQDSSKLLAKALSKEEFRQTPRTTKTTTEARPTSSVMLRVALPDRKAKQKKHIYL